MFCIPKVYWTFGKFAWLFNEKLKIMFLMWAGWVSHMSLPFSGFYNGFLISFSICSILILVSIRVLHLWSWGFFFVCFLLKLLKFGTDSWLILLAHIYNDNDYIVLHFSASCHTEFILALSLFYSWITMYMQPSVHAQIFFFFFFEGG